MFKEITKYVKQHVKLAVTALVIGALVGGTVMGTVQFHVGNNGASAAAVAFKDTKGHWAEPIIKWSVDNKIVDGYPDGTFKPNRHVSEAEFLVMFFRTFKVEPEKVTGMKHWADAYYNFAVSMNYPVKGKTNFDTRNAYMKRLTVAEIISAADGANFKGNTAIAYVMGKGYSTGVDAKNITVENFKGNNNLTRAEAVTFLQKLKSNGFKEPVLNPTAPGDPTKIPSLPVTLTALPSKVKAALDAKIKETKFKGHVVVADNDYVTVNHVHDQYTFTTKISVGFAPSGGNHFIRIEDASDANSLELAVAAAKGAGFTITTKSIADTLKTGKKYEIKNLYIEKSEYEYNVVFVYFK